MFSRRSLSISSKKTVAQIPLAQNQLAQVPPAPGQNPLAVNVSPRNRSILDRIKKSIKLKSRRNRWRVRRGVVDEPQLRSDHFRNGSEKSSKLNTGNFKTLIPYFRTYIPRFKTYIPRCTIHPTSCVSWSFPVASFGKSKTTKLVVQDRKTSHKDNSVIGDGFVEVQTQREKAKMTQHDRRHKSCWGPSRRVWEARTTVFEVSTRGLRTHRSRYENGDERHVRIVPPSVILRGLESKLQGEKYWKSTTYHRTICVDESSLSSCFS